MFDPVANSNSRHWLALMRELEQEGDEEFDIEESMTRDEIAADDAGQPMRGEL